MAFAVFGPGSLFIRRTDVTPSTPVNIGFAQEFSLDITFDKKELYGQKQFPLEVARSTAKVTGKAKAAQVSGMAINSAFFGQSFTSGGYLAKLAEAGSVPASPSYTITVAQAATFLKDLGVVYANTGLPFQRVSAVTGVGQYSVNESTGVYTFNAADASAAVQISYLYSDASATKQKLIVSNSDIGTTPTFELDYVTTNKGKTMVIQCYQAIGDKLAMSFKLTDYMIPELDFSLFQNAAGNVFGVGFPEVS